MTAMPRTPVADAFDDPADFASLLADVSRPEADPG